MRNSFPLFNGTAVSYADIAVKLLVGGGAILETEDIAGVKRGRTLEVGEKRGAYGGQVAAYTTGQAGQEFSWILYRDGYQKYLRALVAAAPRVRGNQYAISRVFFNIEVQHTPIGSSEIFKYVVKACRHKGDSMDHAEGVDADKVEVPIVVTQIVDIIDGKEVVLL